MLSVSGIGPVVAFLLSGACNKIPLHLKGKLEDFNNKLKH